MHGAYTVKMYVTHQSATWFCYVLDIVLFAWNTALGN